MTETLVEPAEPESVVRPLYRPEYDSLVAAGFLGDNGPWELLDGQMVERAAEKSGDHTTVHRRLTRLLFDAIPATEAEIGVEDPLGATDLSEPQPDLMVFRRGGG